MSRLPDDGPYGQVPWLPDERFDMALDAHRGVVTSPTEGENVLTITTHRAILLTQAAGKRTTGLLPLAKLTGVEVIDVSRAGERLPKGLLLFALGALLGWLSWVVVGVLVVSLVVGGLPILASVYMLTGYAFPDQEGALVLHTAGYVLSQPLRSADARRDAYLVAHRLYELMEAGGASTVPEGAPQVVEDPPPLWTQAADTPTGAVQAEGAGELETPGEQSPSLTPSSQQPAASYFATGGDGPEPPQVPPERTVAADDEPASSEPRGTASPS